MRKIFKDESTLKKCKIAQMLLSQPPHISFHTPGHKTAGWDVTELDYTDNLSAPNGCIAEAEKDIAEILGAHKSFILTDGSTSGVLSMLYAAKSLGVKRILTCESAHKSVFNGCLALGLELLLYPAKKHKKIPFPYTMYELKEKFPSLLEEADALLYTSPDYYGNIADLAYIREFCDQTGKLFLIDGAHGGHLHFDKEIYAGTYADMWVDGVHKSLPALTQGAVVSAKTEEYAEALQKGVDIFRTTSPSYPIMASVEYAVKYPRNTELERAVQAYANRQNRVLLQADWTKLYARFGKSAFEVEKALEKQGVFAEFCDGYGILFYLSPATSQEEFDRLIQVLEELFVKYPLTAEKEESVTLFPIDGDKEWVPLALAEGRICAGLCGLFPPCLPLICKGETITKEKIEKLLNAPSTFGLKENTITVVKENAKKR